MAARGRGVRDATTQVAPWLSAGVAGFVSWVTAAGPVIRLGLSGVAPLHRPSFAIDGAGSVFRASAIAGRADLILGWHFP